MRSTSACWTYKKVDGYAPIFAYLGEEGYPVHCQLREGKQHCQDGTPEFLKEAIGYPRQITGTPLLVCLDVGNDDQENMKVCRQQKVDYINQAEPAQGVAGRVARGGAGLRRVRNALGR